MSINMFTSYLIRFTYSLLNSIFFILNYRLSLIYVQEIKYFLYSSNESFDTEVVKINHMRVAKEFYIRVKQDIH